MTSHACRKNILTRKNKISMATTTIKFDGRDFKIPVNTRELSAGVVSFMRKILPLQALDMSMVTCQRQSAGNVPGMHDLAEFINACADPERYMVNSKRPRNNAYRRILRRIAVAFHRAFQDCVRTNRFPTEIVIGPVPESVTEVTRYDCVSPFDLNQQVIPAVTTTITSVESAPPAQRPPAGTLITKCSRDIVPTTQPSVVALAPMPTEALASLTQSPGFPSIPSPLLQLLWTQCGGDIIKFYDSVNKIREQSIRIDKVAAEVRRVDQDARRTNDDAKHARMLAEENAKHARKMDEENARRADEDAKRARDRADEDAKRDRERADEDARHRRKLEEELNKAKISKVTAPKSKSRKVGFVIPPPVRSLAMAHKFKNGFQGVCDFPVCGDYINAAKLYMVATDAESTAPISDRIKMVCSAHRLSVPNAVGVPVISEVKKEKLVIWLMRVGYQSTSTECVLCEEKHAPVALWDDWDKCHVLAAANGGGQSPENKVVGHPSCNKNQQTTHAAAYRAAVVTAPPPTSPPPTHMSSTEATEIAKLARSHDRMARTTSFVRRVKAMLAKLSRKRRIKQKTLLTHVTTTLSHEVEIEEGDRDPKRARVSQ